MRHLLVPKDALIVERGGGEVENGEVGLWPDKKDKQENTVVESFHRSIIFI